MRIIFRTAALLNLGYSMGTSGSQWNQLTRVRNAEFSRANLEMELDSIDNKRPPHFFSCGQIVSRIDSTEPIANRKEWEGSENVRKFLVAATI